MNIKSWVVVEIRKNNEHIYKVLSQFGKGLGQWNLSYEIDELLILKDFIVFKDIAGCSYICPVHREGLTYVTIPVYHWIQLAGIVHVINSDNLVKKSIAKSPDF